MAVIALAVAGAAIGSTFGYAAAGWMVGSMLGQVLFPGGLKGGVDQTTEGPRLGDLSVQVSTYGKMIPIHFGSVRVAGNVIWHGGIIETKHVSTTVTKSGKGGKRGGGGSSSIMTTITYTHSALWRIDPDGTVQFFDITSSVLKAEFITYDPGTGCLFIAGAGGVLIKWSISSFSTVGDPRTAVASVYSLSAFRRRVVGTSFWCKYISRPEAATNLIREINTVTLETTRTIHLVDWGIFYALTSPVYEPLCNALWTLGTFQGNGAIKVLLDRVAATGTTVDLVVTEIVGLAGLDAGDLDVSALANESVRGYIIGRRATARSCIEQLMQAFLFDAVESGGILKFVKRGSVPSLTLGEDDLAAGPPGSDKPPPRLSITRVQDVELPILVNVLYINPDADYQQGHQQARRLAVTTTDQSITVELPMVITDTQAIQLAERIHYTACSS